MGKGCLLPPVHRIGVYGTQGVPARRGGKAGLESSKVGPGNPRGKVELALGFALERGEHHV